MATLNLVIRKLYLPPNITVPITASIYYKGYYDANFILVDANAMIALDGTVTSSPQPTIVIDPSMRYVIRAINNLCNYQYDQEVIITPYCPIGYGLSADGTYCFKQIITMPTPPTNPQNSIAVNNISYSSCGSYIYASGYSPTLGTGTSAQITTANGFWVNGAGACADNNTTDGPLNRAGLWTSAATSGQTIGFSVCVTLPTDTVYYIGMGNDNYGSINLDGNPVIVQNEAALNAQYSNGGACFKVWHIYPLMIPAGNHIIELIGTNVSGPASLGFEIYNNTAAQIIAATSYAGLNLIFSTKDYAGLPIQSGSGGTGYKCPDNFALAYCDSPIVCIQTLTTPILF